MLRGPGESVMMTPKAGREHPALDAGRSEEGAWLSIQGQEIATDWVEGLALPLPHSPNKENCPFRFQQSRWELSRKAS